MIMLNGLSIQFSSGSRTPYFQVSPKKRIRFGMENLNLNLVKKIIDDILNEDYHINVIFIAGYIVNNKRISSKSKIGKFIDIKNWEETIVREEDSDHRFIYATIRNIEKENVIKYCSKILKGHTEAYISFYTDEFLIYVSGDVIDIISNNESKINKLKEYYFELYDKYYEVK